MPARSTLATTIQTRPPATPAVAEPGRRRNRPLDRLDELARALERVLAAAPGDRPGDLAGVSLLAVLAEDPCQLALRRLVHQLPGGVVGGRIHAHVERRVSGVGEPALGSVDLHRRDAEVEEDRVRADAVVTQLL